MSTTVRDENGKPVHKNSGRLLGFSNTFITLKDDPLTLRRMVISASQFVTVRKRGRIHTSQRYHMKRPPNTYPTLKDAMRKIYAENYLINTQGGTEIESSIN